VWGSSSVFGIVEGSFFGLALILLFSDMFPNLPANTSIMYSNLFFAPKSFTFAAADNCFRQYLFHFHLRRQNSSLNIITPLPTNFSFGTLISPC
jgi:hypothetical protein